MAVILKTMGPNKVKVIKAYCEITGKGLSEAKDAVENLPVTIEVSDEIGAINLFKEAGAVAEKEKIFDLKNEVENEGMKEKPYFEYSKIDPNEVAQMDRNRLLPVLNEIKRLTEMVAQYFNQIISANAEIEAVKKHADELRNVVSRWVYGVTVVLVIVLSVIMIPEISWFGIVLAVVGGILIQKNILKVVDAAKNKKKREEEANNYLEMMLPPLQNQIMAAQQNIANIQKSEEGVWAMEIVGKELFNSESMEMLIDIVKSRRADNLKEALNKYDNTEHTSKMEEMQRAIQNASEIAAEEAVRQTAYAEETAKNTHQTATAAKAAAYHTRRISKDVRKLRK